MFIHSPRQALRHPQGRRHAGLVVLAATSACIALQIAHAQARQGRDGVQLPPGQAVAMPMDSSDAGQRVAVGESSAQPAFAPEPHAMKRHAMPEQSWRLSPEQRAVLRDQVRNASDGRGPR